MYARARQAVFKFDLALEGCTHVYELLAGAVKTHSVRVIAERSVWEAKHRSTRALTHEEGEEEAKADAAAEEQ